MMKCQDARGLTPRYLDDELAEAQAAPLRAHLLACPGCRAALQEGKALQAWFVAPPAAVVPDGFAARVARRALAGDRGALTPVPAPAAAAPAAALALSDDRDEHLRTFLVSAVAIAALVLLALSIALRRFDMPGSGILEAEPHVPKDVAVEALREMNERDADLREGTPEDEQR